MRGFLFALLAAIALPSVVACSPKQDFDDGVAVPRGEFRLKGWFYADAVVVDTNPGQEPEVVYDGPIAFKVTYDKFGGHTYFGVLCGPRGDLLECEPEPVPELPFGPDYPITTTIIGTADASQASFTVDTNIDGTVYGREWEITGLSTTIPTTTAINTLPPKFSRSPDEVLGRVE